MEMREKVQSQGAFSARAHERSTETAGTSSVLEVCCSLAHSKWWRLSGFKSTELYRAMGKIITTKDYPLKLGIP